MNKRTDKFIGNYIEIYADGACRDNGKENNIGAIGVVLKYGDRIKEIKEAYTNTTNNRMEILSVIEGLKALKSYNIPVKIYSDSQYVVNTINCNWSKTKNIDLWKQLYDYLGRLSNYEIIWIKGHSDNIYNNRADQLANEAMDALK